MPDIQPCKICHGTGNVECPNQLCAHTCGCTVCNGTGKVEVYEDWSLGFGEEKVRAMEPKEEKTRDEMFREILGQAGIKYINLAVDCWECGKPRSSCICEEKAE